MKKIREGFSKEAVGIWGNPISKLVENKLTLSHDLAELHLYETFQAASRIELQFDTPVMTSMLSGKKSRLSG
ncbi:hypothetical protein [Spirosoma utsteinense]|uniref:Uncharacterized protein n=1 Tax=Spirosoma utsteinense TaxID=2585773 RepID=A0ABR6W6D5_9BACT|nr:hypothetical protein [Spirosoma utsteinense]MBC3792114.1 hypothetical protein [Spirosoma utsteinense]